MRWIPFALVAWIGFGLELGLRDALRLGPGGVAPSFLIPLAVWIALNAPAHTAAWAAITLGVMIDLTRAIPLEGGAAEKTLVGPDALGLLLGVQLVIAMRGLVIRRNPLTMVVLSVLAAVVSQIVVVAMITTHLAWGDPIAWSPARELLERLGGAVYTGATGLFAGLTLRFVEPFMGFAYERASRGHYTPGRAARDGSRRA